MCHYSATPESDTQLKPEGLYLVDSGGQYYEGTTDITRTVALGPITDEEREHFTLVAMSMLRLGHVKFLCSDEPGIYIEGSHGIRTENMIVCKNAEKNQYGQFMEFEYLTYVPIDLDALDVSLMEKKDIQYLNEYHKAVYEKISPYLTEEEAAWLKEATREV